MSTCTLTDAGTDARRLDAQRLDALRLARTENVGPITFKRLVGRFGSATTALDALPDLARRGGRASPLKPFPRDAAERELAALAAIGARMLTLAEPQYPRALAALDDAPPVLSVHGDGDLLDRRAVAIVGARNASTNGRRLATELARDLCDAGLVVVSGLARGIDAAAHRGALSQMNSAGTIAVVAGGVDIAYPPENEALQREIAARGAVLAELPPGTVPQARHFPRRNRLVSGLALGVVVVEAAPRSGSLITARFALEQGREVFAVPGSPLDPRCRGTNNLIREGATLTETAADVLQVLDGMMPRAGIGGDPIAFAEAPDAAASAEDEIGQARDEVLGQLGPSATAVDDLIRQTAIPASLVRTVLLELELAGRLERHAGDRVALIGERLSTL
jgi:DNA processing protein